MVHASMSDPDRPELVVPLPSDVSGFTRPRPRVGDLTPQQREALRSVAEAGDQLSALAEAVTPLISQLGEFVDGIVASLREAGIDVDDPAGVATEVPGYGLPCSLCGDEGHHVAGHDPDREYVGHQRRAVAAEVGIVVARSEDFDPPLTPAQAERAQEAINAALVHDRKLRPEAVIVADAEGRLVNFQGRPVLVDPEGQPILVAGLPVVAPGS